MKKIFWYFILLLWFFITTSTFAQNTDPCAWNPTEECCCQWNNQTTLSCIQAGIICWWSTQWWNTDTGEQCDPSKIYNITPTLTGCCPWVIDENGNCSAWLSDVWINISTDCLLNWQCGLNVYKVMWIRKSNENPTVMWFFQDITLATTTAILGTVLVIALIVSGIFFSIASITWKDTKKSKTIIIDCLVWLLLVMWSYTIIRLIQFIATAWS